MGAGDCSSTAEGLATKEELKTKVNSILHIIVKCANILLVKCTQYAKDMLSCVQDASC
jgi:hypothetical protein